MGKAIQARRYSAVTPEWTETDLGEAWEPAEEFTAVVDSMCSAGAVALGHRPLTDEEIEELAGAVSARLRPFDDVECPCFIMPKLFGQYNIILRSDLPDPIRRHAVAHELAHIVAGHVDAGKVPPVRYRQEDTIADMIALLVTREPEDRDPERSCRMVTELAGMWGEGGAAEARHRLVSAAWFVRTWEGSHSERNANAEEAARV